MSFLVHILWILVINALDEPIAGWNDNLNGPMSLMLAAAKGLLRTSLSKLDLKLNYIPVDLVIKAIILATYDNYTESNCNEVVEVYNITQPIINLTHEPFGTLARSIVIDLPVPNVLWYPRPSLTSCYYNFYLQSIFYQMLPAMFFDIVLKLMGKKTMVVKIQRKLYISTVILMPFTMQNFTFKNDKMINILKKLRKTNPDFDFRIKLSHEELCKFLIDMKNGTVKYTLKESMDPTGQTEKKHLQRLKIFDIILKIILVCLSCWLLLFKFNTIEWSLNQVYNYFQKL